LNEVLICNAQKHQCRAEAKLTFIDASGGWECWRQDGVSSLVCVCWK